MTASSPEDLEALETPIREQRSMSWEPELGVLL